MPPPPPPIVVLCFLFSGLLAGQSLTGYQRLEACRDWRCVVNLVGETSLRLDRSIPWRLPLRRSRLTSSFGSRRHPVAGGQSFHDGIDIAAPLGSRVYAAASGRITTGYSSTLGNYVSIDHLNGFVSVYGHLDQVWVTTGRLVAQSTPIGTVGISGRTTGPHLHWATRYAAPADNASSDHRADVHGKMIDPLELRRNALVNFQSSLLLR